MSNIISILSSPFIVYVALSTSCLCDQCRPEAEAIVPFYSYCSLSKHNQLNGNHHPEQILLSQTVNHMALLTLIGCGSSCHSPCSPFRQIDGTWYIVSPFGTQQHYSGQQCSADSCPRFLKVSIKPHVTFYLGWSNRRWNRLSGDVMHPRAAMLEILCSLATNNSEQLVVLQTWLSQWN